VGIAGTRANPASPQASAAEGVAQPSVRLSQQLRPTILGVLLLSFMTGGIFPLLLWAFAATLLAPQGAGSLIMRHGSVVGSRLIGQQFSGAQWFHPRPSAAGKGYDATASGGTNLAPGNPALKQGAPDFTGIGELAAQYRRDNALAPDTPIPIDAVTRSGSGLDPDISPTNAFLQVGRVAAARGLDESTVRQLVSRHVTPPQLGFLGEPRASVLELNLALERLPPGAARPPGPQ